MKRILSLDGGGVRGIFSLQVLARIESLFREYRQRPELVLADEFDMFAGTSTGAIIAAGLCWGMTVAQVEEFYLKHGEQMFTRTPFYRRWKCKYQAEYLAALFKQVFSEDEAGLEPALLGSAKLRRLLLLVMRNATTGSAWPITNNPQACFNDRLLSDCNLDVPLWQLLRASTAAPSFYAPEAIKLGEQEFLFVDGAITPYNNPALIAVLTATLPVYRVGWKASADELLLVSVGTVSRRARLRKKLPHQVHLLDLVGFVPKALIASNSTQQDMLCRVLGRCVHGDPIDGEVGDLREPSLLGLNEQKFSYARYDASFEEPAGAVRNSHDLDNLALLPLLKEQGQAYAEKNIRLSHLLASTQALRA